jgi:outer membrane receptor protein involved in Fe transport
VVRRSSSAPAARIACRARLHGTLAITLMPTQLGPRSQKAHNDLLPHSPPDGSRRNERPRLEIAAKRDFDLLPGVLRHLGALGNITLADGDTDVLYSGTVVTFPLIDLSKVSTNATLYFDMDLWGIRGSIATRDKYRRGSGGNGNIGEYFKVQTNFDASAYFNLTQNLKLTLKALNISNQPIIQYADKDAQRMMTNAVSGRTILFGATMRF